jgi:hypothetical protein
METMGTMNTVPLVNVLLAWEAFPQLIRSHNMNCPILSMKLKADIR